MYYTFLFLLIVSSVLLTILLIINSKVDDYVTKEKLEYAIVGCIGLIIMSAIIVFFFEPSGANINSDNPWDYINTI